MLSRTSFSCSGVKDVSKVNGGYSVTRLRQSGPSVSSKTSKAGKIKKKNKNKRKKTLYDFEECRNDTAR